MHRLKDRSLLMRIGLACFLASTLSRWFIHPATSSAQNALDGAVGFLTGVAIACLLSSLRHTQCSRPIDPD